MFIKIRGVCEKSHISGLRCCQHTPYNPSVAYKGNYNLLSEYNIPTMKDMSAALKLDTVHKRLQDYHVPNI